MRFSILALLAVVGTAAASCSPAANGSGGVGVECATSNGGAGTVQNCDAASAKSKKCNDSNGIYRAPLYCCPK